MTDQQLLELCIKGTDLYLNFIVDKKYARKMFLAHRNEIVSEDVQKEADEMWNKRTSFLYVLKYRLNGKKHE